MVACELERVRHSGYSSPTVRLRQRRKPACWITVCLAVVGAVSTLLGCGRISSNEPPGQIAEQRSPQSQVAVTISAETTYITEPLRKDGYPDYVAALNLRCSQRVNPADNAAVSLWMAVGPSNISEKARHDYFRLLGIPPLPLEGAYFVPFEKYAARPENSDQSRVGSADLEATSDAWEQVSARGRRPWSAQECPVMAAWLTANEAPLKLVVEASKRPLRYDPLIAGEDRSLLVVGFPAVAQYRDVARALAVRAMLRLNGAEVDAAWDDLLACHRLARLVRQGPTVMEAGAAGALLETACHGDQALLQSAHLTADQIAKMRGDLAALPPWPQLSDRFDIAERWTYLNIVCDFSREGPAGFKYIEPGRQPELRGSLAGTIKSLRRYSIRTPLDWNIALRMGNAWFDRIVDAYRKPTRAEQKAALTTLAEEMRELQKAAADTASLDEAMRDDPQKALSERLGLIFLSEFTPAILLLVDGEDVSIMHSELDQLALALAAYRAEHGTYPAELAELAPTLGRTISCDLFTGAPLHYRREKDGIVMYSVGVNRTDDGAKGYYDRAATTDTCDDLAVHLTAPQ